MLLALLECEPLYQTVPPPQPKPPGHASPAVTDPRESQNKPLADQVCSKSTKAVRGFDLEELVQSKGASRPEAKPADFSLSIRFKIIYICVWVSAVPRCMY